MRHTALTMLTASTMLVATVVGMPSSAQSQTVIIITGNGSAQPYYPNPYPYQPRVYAAPTLYGETGYAAEYADSGYYQSYYNGYYRPYQYGYYRPYRYGGYRGW